MIRSNPSRTPVTPRQSLRNPARSLCVIALLALMGCAQQPIESIHPAGSEAPETAAPTQSHQLSLNNRRVALHEAGAPDGFPVFYAHGNPGSGLELAFFHQSALTHGFRLIAIDRPGFGASEFTAPYTLTQYAEDIETLAQQMGITRFGTLGWSSGGPPSLAVAYRAPGKVAFVISASGYTNFGEYPDAPAALAELGRPGAELSASRPGLFDAILKTAGWTEHNLPRLYARLALATMTTSDQAVLDAPERRSWFLAAQSAAVQQGIDGVRQDLEVQWQPWEFQLEDIVPPVMIIQGKTDTFVPWQFGEHLCQRLRQCELWLLEGQGHLAPLTAPVQDALFRFARRHVSSAANSAPSGS